MIFTIADNNLDVFISQVSDRDAKAINQKFSLSLADCGKRFFHRAGAPPTINFYDFNKSRINLHLLPDLIEFCNATDKPFTIVDERKPWTFPMVPIEEVNENFLDGITMYDYQLRCAHAVYNNDFGIIDAVTGAGKTEIIACACKMNEECKIIILSEQRIVIEQIKSRLKLRDIADVGMFYAGQTPKGQSIVIASIQSSVKINKTKMVKPTQDLFIREDEWLEALANYESERPEPSQFDDVLEYNAAVEEYDSLRPQREAFRDTEAYVKALTKYEGILKGFKNRNTRAEDLRDIIRESDILIVDEADLATSAMYRSIFRNFFKGRKRYGFTGTLNDPDKIIESMKLRAYLGPVIETVHRHEVLAVGRINDIKYTMVVLAGEPNEIHDSSTLNIAVDEKLTQNAKFHKIIKTLCSFHKDEKTLILVENKNLGYALEKLLVGSKFICGDTGKKVRNSTVQEFASGSLNILIGGKILRRGFDLVGGCDNVILATGGKMESDLRQKIGRGFRRSKRGYTQIYDFMFRVNKYLYNHSRSRLKIMIKLGFETVVIYPNGFKINGADLVKRNFNVGKNWRQTT